MFLKKRNNPQTPQKVIHSYSGISYLLDFLLKVETTTHDIIIQTPDDSSRFGNGSFYGDIKDLKIIKATLFGKGHELSLSLIDGHAQLNGQFLFPPKQPPITGLLTMTYHRQVQQSLMTNYGENTKVIAPKVKYFLGWEKIHNGKRYAWELGIA